MTRRIIIPARLASSRLPGKILLNIAGKPMLQHVYERVSQCDVDSVLIATESEQVLELAQSWGADVCLTDANHPSGTDRTAEAARIKGYADADLIVNVQGDEPLIPIANVHQVFIDLEQHPQAAMATLRDRLSTLEAVMNPHAVKVVTDKEGFALYFSRAPIPWARDVFPGALPADQQHWLHIGIYGYRCEFLKHYAELEPSPLETIEALEQLRVLWHGRKIYVGVAPEPNPPGVDTEAGLQHVRGLMG